MPANIRNRLLVILVLIVGSIFSLLPGTMTVRERNEAGVISEREIEKTPLKLGLDLKGGMHLLLELDQSQTVSVDPDADLKATLEILRKRMDQFGVAEPLIQQVGNRIVVELAGINDPERAKRIVNRAAVLEFRFTDKTDALVTAIPAMDRALGAMGIKAPGAATDKGVSSLLGKDSTSKDSTSAGPILQSMIQPGRGMPGEYMVAEANYPLVDSLLNLPEIKRLWPRGYELRFSNELLSAGQAQVRGLYVLEEKSIVTGQDLESAAAITDPLTNSPTVTFELNRQGGRRFGEQTGSHVGDYMAIVLDRYVQGAPPTIRSRIDRNGQIELKGRTLVEAQDLANTLKAGALRVPIKVVNQRVVKGTLGATSIRQGITAGIVGTALVVLIMIGYYATSGLLAVVGLALYILFTLAALAALEATLTLPGLAGIVLSIGIAVDANVLIFERIREELAHGKSTGLAVDDGFHRAMNAIIDSNVCTILTAFILFQLGAGPVRGFATTLIIGTLASMVTAIFVTRTFFLLWLSKRDSTAPLSI